MAIKQESGSHQKNKNSLIATKIYNRIQSLDEDHCVQEKENNKKYIKNEEDRI